jgi:hypothetical protein
MYGFNRIRQWVFAGALSAALIGGLSAGPAEAAARKNSNVGVAIQRSAVAADGTLDYTVTVVSSGELAVKRVIVTVPFDASALQPVSGALQSDAGQVTLGASAVEIRTGVLAGDGDSAQATLRFRDLPGHAGAGLTQRASFSWSASDVNGSGISNLPVAGQASLAVTSEGRDLVFEGSVFGSNEGITYWYNTPSGSVVAMRIRDGYLLDGNYVDARKDAHTRNNKPGKYDEGSDHMFADAAGTVSVRFSTAGLAPGAYTVVARGTTSGLIAVGAFEIM